MKALLAILMILPFACLADEPVIFTLDAENVSYTVPENCVLVVNAINSNLSTGFANLAIIIGDESFPWSMMFIGQGYSNHPHRAQLGPIKIPGGGMVKFLSAEEWSVSAGTLTFFCTLNRVSKGNGVAAGRRISMPSRLR